MEQQEERTDLDQSEQEPQSSGETLNSETDSEAPQPDVEQKAAQQLQDMQQQLNASQANQTALIEALKSNQPAAAEEASPSFGEEDFAKAYEEGTLGNLIGQVTKHHVGQALNQFEQEKFEPLRVTGQAAIQALNKRTAEADLPYLRQYEKEIEEAINQFPESNRMHPDALKVAHNLVVGKHFGDILKAEKEALLRQIRSGEVEVPGSNTGRSERGSNTPSARDLVEQGLLDKNALKIIESRGGEEAFAAKASRGRKDWAEYAKGLMV